MPTRRASLRLGSCSTDQSTIARKHKWTAKNEATDSQNHRAFQRPRYRRTSDSGTMTDAPGGFSERSIRHLTHRDCDCAAHQDYRKRKPARRSSIQSPCPGALRSAMVGKRHSLAA